MGKDVKKDPAKAGPEAFNVNKGYSIQEESLEIQRSERQCKSKQCHKAELSDTATLHLCADVIAARRWGQIRIQSLLESKDVF